MGPTIPRSRSSSAALRNGEGFGSTSPVAETRTRLGMAGSGSPTSAPTRSLPEMTDGTPSASTRSNVTSASWPTDNESAPTDA